LGGETVVVKTKDKRFLVSLRALPGAVPETIRLRRFLKCALRAFGLKAESIVEVEHEPQAAAPVPPLPPVRG
jgi:hypothetical protein